MNDSASIFEDGKLKPGIYKIQNIFGQTYVDIREHTRELCCRPPTLLDGKGLVGLRSPLVRIVVIIVILDSGKSSLRVSDIQYAGCSLKSHFPFVD